MPRVVPSQVVTFIDRVFPWAATQLENQNNMTALQREHSGRLAALIALIQQILQGAIGS